MSVLVTDCPRCDAKRISFDVGSCARIPDHTNTSGPPTYEVFCVCRHCHQATIFVLEAKPGRGPVDVESMFAASLPSSVNACVSVREYVCIKHFAAHSPPEHLPKNIKSAFEEGAACFAVGCFNAACTMFRLCLDLVVRDEFAKLSSDEKAKKQTDVKEKILDMGNLASKLNWLFENKKIPANFRELADCIRNYGNDGAHEGNLRKEDKADVGNLLDFTHQILEDVYTRRENAAILAERRKKRRSEKSGG